MNYFVSFLMFTLALASCAAAPAFDKVESLVAERQYESAWKALDAISPQDDKVLARRIQLCLDGFAQSLNHMAFALKDLKPDETLDGVRQAQGSYDLHSLDVPALVEAWQKSHPRSALLDRTLGDFYNQVSQIYEGYAGMSPEQVAQKATEAYELAWKSSPFTGASADSYAVLLLKAGQWDRAIPVLDAALAAKGETHRDAHYNKAFALWQQNKLPAAAQEAELAIESYRELPEMQVDAALLGFDIRYAQGDWAAAQKALDRGRSASATDGRLGRRTMMLGLARTDYLQAAEGANQWLHSTPDNPQVLQQIISDYKASNATKGPKELDAFFAAQVESWANEGQHGMSGLVAALWAHSLLDDGRKADARPLLDRAEVGFKRLGPLSPELKQYLKELRDRL